MLTSMSSFQKEMCRLDISMGTMRCHIYVMPCVNTTFVCGLQVRVPFRLDLEEAYFNKKSVSRDASTPFWGNSTAIPEPRLAQIQTGIVVVVVNLTGRR